MRDTLLSRVHDYLIGLSTIRELETWLLSHLQEILDTADQKGTELANQIDADLVELGEGVITASVFYDRLQNYYLATMTTSASFSGSVEGTRVHACTSAETIHHCYETPGHSITHRLSHVFA